MIQIKLNISERLYALRILNEFKGSLEKLASILQDIKQFAIKDDEWIKAERSIEGEGDTVIWKWSDEKGEEITLAIEKDTANYLKEILKGKDEKGEFTLQDKAAMTLFGKLN